MNNLVLAGAEQACYVLSRFGSSWYQKTCLGYEHVDRYYWAGVVFWLCIGLGLVAALYAIRKAITYAFHSA